MGFEILILMALLYLALVAGYVAVFRIQEVPNDDDKREGFQRDWIRCIIICIVVVIAMVTLVVAG